MAPGIHNLNIQAWDTGANAYNQQAFSDMIAPAGDDTHEKYWVKHDHQPISGITPLEHYTGG